MLEVLKQLADRVVSLMRSDPGAFPNPVGRKQRGDFLGIVIVVTDRAVASLEFFDRLDVLENGDSFFELGNIHFKPPALKPPRVPLAALDLRDARVKRCDTSPPATACFPLPA